MLSSGEYSGSAAGGLFQTKVAVQEDYLDARQEGIRLIRVPSARPNHPVLLIREVNEWSSRASPAREQNLR